MNRRLAPLLCIATFAFAHLLNAAEIVKMKGSGALINLQGQSASPGDTFFALDGSQKKAIIRISKVKGDKAIGRVVKGSAKPGMTLTPRAAGMAKAGHKSHGTSTAGSDSGNRAFWGFMGGASIDSMSATVNSATVQGTTVGSVNMSGMGFSGMALFDYELFNQVWFRGLAGLEQFNASGGNICGSLNNSACNASIMYFSVDFIGRYIFATGAFRPWLGLGVELLLAPLTKSSTVLDPASISTSNVVAPQAGFDWYINPQMYIPVSVEYGFLPKSSNVTPTWIAFRAGLAFSF